ncbi:MAG: MBL fold metallo-hydrolase [Bacteroidetes bacterium]|nr:MBL fold metallo-hydrolase [Rhodothermia bacterium]MCS7155880.1 MBL fold metallo-hydrolase [Bacteroidota bacterium]MCX7906019.1 MBL fold metallo-hydrolase [Bacteroidota bacterium]MDW8138147.1 MBL fold metallo-hydrolase [Bacteroidota bacterium]MDW8285831.1 MBL fold metallo-hydrolase [Bacteroidota bacterium]
MRLLLCTLCLVFGLGVNAQPRYFDWKEVAPGVYAAIGKPGVLSNAAVIITEEGVVVVDTHLRPSWARDLIEQIRRLSRQPVRFVINTHWHNDHTHGNRAYQAAFPQGVIFIAHHLTREDLIQKGIPNLEQTRRTLPERIAQWRRWLAEGRREDGTLLDEAGRRQLEAQIADNEAYLRELEQLELKLPDLTFDRSLRLWLGGRPIDVLYFGEGHTRGDVFVYLPQEKVLITGDMLVGGLPFMRDATPLAWASTLEQVGRLEIRTIIPGHGEVQTGTARLALTVQYLRDLEALVREQIQRGASLEAATEALLRDERLMRYEREFPNFRAGLTGPNGNITKMYQALRAHGS